MKDAYVKFAFGYFLGIRPNMTQPKNDKCFVAYDSGLGFGVLGFRVLGFRVIEMENQMEKNIENNMETEIMCGIIQGLGF